MLARSPEVTFDVVDEQAVLVDPDGRELVTLNQVGSLVWAALDGTQNEDDLVDMLSDRFPEVDAALLRSDLRSFLDDLTSSGLIEPTGD